ncbi:MAG TPA: hypothetical protein VMV10_15230 [Pirellulales bacterium]|nr:hypothetical protein [Pirellulales bacterium]
MLTCKEASRLASESLDRKLTWRQRINLWVHLAMCRLCYGFAKDIKQLHEAARLHADDAEKDAAPADVALSAEARARMKRALLNRKSE